MSSIFHYTSNEGAVGIIKSACLFATQYKYLNDARELILGREIILPIFEKEFRDGIQKAISQGEISAKVLDEYGDKLYRHEAANLFQSAITVTDQTTPVFISSFCRHEVGSE